MKKGMEENYFREKYKGQLKIKKSPVDSRTLKASLILPKIKLPIKTNNVALELPVRDQGNLPICAGMAGASDQELMDVQDIGLDEWLSPMYLYNNRKDPAEDGMDNLDLMKIRQKKGTCLERLYPIGSMREPSAEAVINALNHRIGPYAQIDTLEALKTVLASGRSCVTAIPVYNFTERMWYKIPGDVLEGGHDVKSVDYNDETRKILVKNSWGKEFGKNGYVEMDYNDFDLVWEFWSAVDLPSVNPEPIPEPEPEPKKKSWFARYWWALLLGAGIIIALTYFIISK